MQAPKAPRLKKRDIEEYLQKVSVRQSTNLNEIICKGAYPMREKRKLDGKNKNGALILCKVFLMNGTGERFYPFIMSIEGNAIVFNSSQ